MSRALLLFLILSSAVAEGVSLPFQGTESASTRVQRLDPYFIPRIGQIVELDPKGIQNAQGTRDYLDVRGYVQIKPPKNQCFTVTRRESLPDVKVCQQTSLWFDLSDLYEDGTLHWTVSTGPSDFGTELIWQTNYRFMRFIPMTKKIDEGAERLPIASCKVVKSPLSDRRMHITLLDGRVWVVALPKNDILIEQRVPPDNLYIFKKEDNSWAEALKAKPNESSEGESKKKPKLSPEEEQKLLEESKIKSNDVKLQTAYSQWIMTHRGSFAMDSAGIIIDGKAMPSGSSTNSQCWYRFEINPKTKTGELECHEVGTYRIVYMPLTCLHELSKSGSSGGDNP